MSVHACNFSVGSIRSQSADSEKYADLRLQADASAVRTSVVCTNRTLLALHTVEQSGGQHASKRFDVSRP
jgi:hypothetical protein